MIADILREFNIFEFGAIRANKLGQGNPRLLASLPQSELNVIFMLFPYYTGECPNISKYACVHDYHFFAKEVFSRLEEYFALSHPSTFAKGFSDHSPFKECHGAAMAGLGIMGRHSLLINEKYSSYVFIGELITDLSREELEREGIPFGNGEIRCCEGCALCERACPAACAGGSDREGCLSAITQKKGDLSPYEKKIIADNGYIWGCDICQDACPHTKKALEKGTIYTSIPYFLSSAIEGDPLESILKMDGEEFALYPFAWRGRAPIERNIRLVKAHLETSKTKEGHSSK